MIDEAQRLKTEREFHNERFGSTTDVRDPLDKWYSALGSGARKHVEAVLLHANGSRVLEYGCADGQFSLIEHPIAKSTSKYCGIDISDQAILRARSTAAEHGLERCEFDNMDAHAMTYPDACFDLVFGKGIIHHLDLSRSFSEIARVLRPGGVAIFYEPMGHNPLINGFRTKTPHLRTPDEHPLLVDDFRLAKSYFKDVQRQYFGLATLCAVPLRNSAVGGGVMQLCEGIDQLILKIPVLREQAWHVLISMTK